MNKIFENMFVGLILLALRVYLGLWFIYLVISKAMYLPQAWLMLGGAMKFLGLGFLPHVWGFIAVLTYVVGSLFLISGRFFRLGAAGLAFTMIVATRLHFALGQGLTAAKPALTFLVLFLILLATGPGRYVLSSASKKKATVKKKQAKSKR